MSMSEKEILFRSEEIFGTLVGEEKLSELTSLLASLERANLGAVTALSPKSEPMGHRAILREASNAG